MQTIATSVLLTPDNDALRFLPEGPYRNGNGKISWVAIQHGADKTHGSLNLLDLESLENRNVELAGRPGFAFPTDDPQRFVVGAERSVVLLDIESGATEVLTDEVDQAVSGTVINDGLVVDGNLVFGCKDLTFSEKKAGLYLLRPNRTLVQLADDQICSNGKAVRPEDDGKLSLFDICSPSKMVKQWDLDIDAGTIANPRTIVDLTAEEVFPDGMILTPDQKSVIVAIFNPGDATVGEARQYSIASGELEVTWTCEGSPRVTCPQLVEHAGGVKLVLTTADEGMPDDVRAKNPNAGCLFIGDTPFASLNENPVYAP